MKKTLAVLAAAAALSSTALLLLADSARQCKHAAQTQAYAVSGDCGPSGQITLRSAQDRCEISVENAAAVGLPADGQIGAGMSLAARDWWLNGPVQVPATAEDGGIDPDGGTVEEWRDCRFPNDGGTLLECVVAADSAPACTATVQTL